MEFSDICKAYKKCAKGKRRSGDCSRFEMRLGRELYLLEKEINSGKYKPAAGKCFIVTKPRVREIWASTFRDRVVHHLIVKPLELIWEPKFHPKSFACRKGKGLHAAIEDFKKQVRSISQGGMKEVWALQLDIESFFFTIDRDILKNLFLSQIHDPEVRRLIVLQFVTDPRANFKKVGDQALFKHLPPEKSWHSRRPRQGIPIGNLTSQFGANLYLNKLDHFIGRRLRPKGYLRYMDDMTLLDTDPERLQTMIAVVDEWLKVCRRQTLNPTKTILKPLRDGIKYLGFELRQVDSPREPLIVLPQGEKKAKLVDEAKRLERLYFNPIKAHEVAFFVHHRNRREFQRLNSRLGLLAHCESYRLRQSTLVRLSHVFKVDKPDALLTVRKDFGSVKI